MTFSNYQIYEYMQVFSDLFEKQDLYIPIKANFVIQKNIRTITTAGIEIEKARLTIGQHYGKLNEDQSGFLVPQDKLEKANQEITDLFSIEQNLDIRMIKLEDLGDAELTARQMQAIMFMIED